MAVPEFTYDAFKEALTRLPDYGGYDALAQGLGEQFPDATFIPSGNYHGQRGRTQGFQTKNFINNLGLPSTGSNQTFPLRLSEDVDYIQANEDVNQLKAAGYRAMWPTLSGLVNPQYDPAAAAGTAIYNASLSKQQADSAANNASFREMLAQQQRQDKVNAFNAAQVSITNDPRLNTAATHVPTAENVNAGIELAAERFDLSPTSSASLFAGKSDDVGGKEHKGAIDEHLAWEQGRSADKLRDIHDTEEELQKTQPVSPPVTSNVLAYEPGQAVTFKANKTLLDGSISDGSAERYDIPQDNGSVSGPTISTVDSPISALSTSGFVTNADTEFPTHAPTDSVATEGTIAKTINIPATDPENVYAVDDTYVQPTTDPETLNRPIEDYHRKTIDNINPYDNLTADPEGAEVILEMIEEQQKEDDIGSRQVDLPDDSGITDTVDYANTMPVDDSAAADAAAADFIKRRKQEGEVLPLPTTDGVGIADEPKANTNITATVTNTPLTSVDPLIAEGTTAEPIDLNTAEPKKEKIPPATTTGPEDSRVRPTKKSTAGETVDIDDKEEFKGESVTADSDEGWDDSLVPVDPPVGQGVGWADSGKWGYARTRNLLTGGGQDPVVTQGPLVPWQSMGEDASSTRYLSNVGDRDYFPSRLAPGERLGETAPAGEIAYVPEGQREGWNQPIIINQSPGVGDGAGEPGSPMNKYLEDLSDDNSFKDIPGGLTDIPMISLKAQAGINELRANADVNTLREAKSVEGLANILSGGKAIAGKVGEAFTNLLGISDSDVKSDGFWTKMTTPIEAISTKEFGITPLDIALVVAGGVPALGRVLMGKLASAIFKPITGSLSGMFDTFLGGNKVEFSADTSTEASQKAVSDIQSVLKSLGQNSYAISKGTLYGPSGNVLGSNMQSVTFDSAGNSTFAGDIRIGPNDTVLWSDPGKGGTGKIWINGEDTGKVAIKDNNGEIKVGDSETSGASVPTKKEGPTTSVPVVGVSTISTVISGPGSRRDRDDEEEDEEEKKKDKG